MTRGREIRLLPDGSGFLYATENSGIFRHSFSTGESSLIDGTEGATDPVVSPDGREIAFFRDFSLFSLPLDGGTPNPLSEVPFLTSGPWGFSWGTNGDLIFSNGDLDTQEGARGLWRLGRADKQLTHISLSDELGGFFITPEVLPNGKILATVTKTKAPELVVIDPETSEVVSLGQHGTGARYLTTGKLVYAHENALWSANWDPSLEPAALQPPAFVTDIALENFSYAGFDVLENGSLVLERRSPSSLSIVGSGRAPESLPIDAGFLRHPRVSPDGSLIAFTRGGHRVAQVWIHQLEIARTYRLRTSADPEDRNEVFPQWTQDGRLVFFDPYPSANQIRIGRVDRAESTVLFEDTHPLVPTSVSEGGVLLFKNTRSDSFWQVPIDGSEAARILFEPEGYVAQAAISPNGQWAAYMALVRGNPEIVVRSLKDDGLPLPVSSDGGRAPVWSRDGDQLFYHQGDTIWSAAVKQSGDTIDIGRPQPVLRGVEPGAWWERHFDPLPDGRFVVVEPGKSTVFEVNLNVAELLQKPGR